MQTPPPTVRKDRRRPGQQANEKSFNTEGGGAKVLHSK